MTANANRIALRTSLLYAAISGLWIQLSDRALELFWSDQRAITHLQTYKGWGFVAVTAGLLYLGLRTQLRHRDKINLERESTAMALKASVAKLNGIFSAAPVGIGVAVDGVLQDVNVTLCRMLGYFREDLTGKDARFLHATPEDNDIAVQAYRQLEPLKIATNESRFRHRDGRILDVAITSVLLDAANPAAGVLFTVTDISARKRAELELQEKQAQLLEAMRIARLGYWEYDVRNDQFRFNDQFYAILRTTAEREGGYLMTSAQYARRFVHPEDMAVVGAEIGRALTAADPNFRREITHRVIYADGDVGQFAVHIRIRKDAGGRTVQTYGANMDITGHMRAEEQARHLASFPELNPNPVLEFTPEGKMVYHNPAALAMARKVGVPNLVDLLPRAAPQIVAECLATNQPRSRLETRHGNHTLSWAFYPIAAQRVVHCYVGDITERQQLESQLRQAQKMEAVGQLAGGVAHDFNNLLTAIIGHLGLLRLNPQLTPEMAESLNEITDASNRAANLTSQLLAFSRRQVISTAILDMNEVVPQLAKMLRRVLGEHITLEVDYAPERLAFQGDAGMIDQVLLNLAVNARDAMPGGGTLRITTRGAEQRIPAVDGKAGRIVHLMVSDTGAGISPEVLPRIFEPFFTTKDVGKGTGLGLATVFSIVQQHHGTIEVESEVGRGTTFHLRFPRLESAGEAQPAEVSEAPPKGRGETILLVEDEPAVRDVGVVSLRRYGYRVLTAANGHEAVEIWGAHRSEIELLLTDLIMPGGLSGLQLARQLLQEKPELRIVYTSGYSPEIAGRDLALKDGSNYLAKPYELDHLFRTVRRALDGKQSRPPF